MAYQESSRQGITENPHFYNGFDEAKICLFSEPVNLAEAKRKLVIVTSGALEVVEMIGALNGSASILDGSFNDRISVGWNIQKQVTPHGTVLTFTYLAMQGLDNYEMLVSTIFGINMQGFQENKNSFSLIAKKTLDPSIWKDRMQLEAEVATMLTAGEFMVDSKLKAADGTRIKRKFAGVSDFELAKKTLFPSEDTQRLREELAQERSKNPDAKLEEEIRRLRGELERLSNDSLSKLDPQGHYRALGLHPNCFDGMTQAQRMAFLRSVYGAISHIKHPDKGGSNNAMARANLAFEYFKSVFQ